MDIFSFFTPTSFLQFENLFILDLLDSIQISFEKKKF